MAGASIGLLIVGLLIGVAGMYFYMYRKGNKASDTIDLIENCGGDPNYEIPHSHSDNYDNQISPESEGDP